MALHMPVVETAFPTVHLPNSVYGFTVTFPMWYATICQAYLRAWRFKQQPHLPPGQGTYLHYFSLPLPTVQFFQFVFDFVLMGGYSVILCLQFYAVLAFGTSLYSVFILPFQFLWRLLFLFQFLTYPVPTQNIDSVLCGASLSWTYLPVPMD